MIPPPHGGRLIDRRLSDPEAKRRRDELVELPKLAVEIDQIFDLDKIGIGAYSPLEGFPDRAAIESILSDGRLPGGLPWTMPILLTPPGRANAARIGELRPGDTAALVAPGGRAVGLLHLEEKFPLDRKAVARATYGTLDPAHPNVSDLAATGDVALAGRIDLLERAPGPLPEHELTPREAREEFQRLGWRSVVGYQTRNIPHRAHEYLQRLALEREEIDGLFVHPVVGRLKAGDYRSDVVVRAYEILLGQYFPPDRARLATLAITMRYAGPRAALFLALVRKNFGCSHYIVGRDQAGVGGLYDPYEAHRIFDRYETGIVPLRFSESFVCRPCGGVASPKTCRHPESDRESVSQTRVRAAIRAREPLPAGLLRPEVEEYLLRLGPAALNLAAERPAESAEAAAPAAAARVPGE